jgi:hypothetical protein
MRDLRLSTALAGIVATCGMTSAPATTASEIQQTLLIPGAACQLSIPTTNTGVRPKATGFRNESTTTSNFVICPLVTPTVRSSNVNPLKDGYIILASLDGQAHSVSCTAVAGLGGNVAFPATYSTKTILVPAATTEPVSGNWTLADFGQSSGDSINASAWFSVTCNLPAQVQIQFLQGNYWVEIGS